MTRFFNGLHYIRTQLFYIHIHKQSRTHIHPVAHDPSPTGTLIYKILNSIFYKDFPLYPEVIFKILINTLVLFTIILNLFFLTFIKLFCESYIFLVSLRSRLY